MICLMVWYEMKLIPEKGCKKHWKQELRWFLSIALRIPTAHDFCVISARKLARAPTQLKKFPSS